mgnify:CR=1 FL=1
MSDKSNEEILEQRIKSIRSALNEFSLDYKDLEEDFEDKYLNWRLNETNSPKHEDKPLKYSYSADELQSDTEDPFQSPQQKQELEEFTHTNVPALLKTPPTLKMPSSQKDQKIKELAQIQEDLLWEIQTAKQELKDVVAYKDSQIEELNQRLNTAHQTQENQLSTIKYLKAKLENPENYQLAKAEIKELRSRNRQLEFQLESYSSENEQLKTKINQLQKDLEESIKQNKNLDPKQSSDSFKSKIEKFEELIEHLKDQNKSLKLELYQKPSHQDLEKANRKIEELQSTVKKTRSVSKVRKSPRTLKPNEHTKVLKDLMEQYNVTNPEKLVTKINSKDSKSKLFIKRIQDLILENSGKETQKPTLKSMWRWINRLFEEYLKMKKQAPLHYDIIKKLTDALDVEYPKDLIKSISSILAENEKLYVLANKVKKLLKLDPNATIEDIIRHTKT